MKSFNNISLKGRLYNYELSTYDSDKGTAITGRLSIEVGTDGTLVTAEYFAYPTFNNGKTNATYGILDSIMEGNYKTVVDQGDDADWIAATGSIDVNYFVSKNGNSGGDDDLARSQKVRGAFINANKDKKYENQWKLDFVVTRIADIEEDVDKGIPRYARLSGYLVDAYNKRVMEVQFRAQKEEAINYLTTLEATAAAPYFASTWGKFSKIVRQVVRKNAFGDDEVDEYNSIIWEITGQNPEPYEFADDTIFGEAAYEEFVANLATFKEEAKAKAEAKESGAAKDKKKLSF